MKLSRIIVAVLATSGMIYTNITVAAPPNMTIPPDLKCDSSDGGNTVTITWHADSPLKTYSYTIALNHTGNSWTYTLTNGPGNQKALSHWVLPIPSCQSHLPNPPLPNPNPLPNDWGVDPTTQVDGAKWDTPSWSTSSTYSSTYTLTLDKNYPETLVDIAFKSATYYGICKIVGPDCSGDPPLAAHLTAFTAKATGNGTKVEFTTGYEEDITAFNLYRGTPKVGTECSANPDDYNNLTVLDTIPSGPGHYEFDDESTVGTGTTVCYGLVSINNSGQVVDILGAVPRQ